MAADKHSEKIKHTLQVYGWYHKFRDIGYTPQGVQVDAGMADSILLPLGYPCQRVFIEHKYARDRFPFDQWHERQRLFHVACAFSRLPYWMFLVMGVKIVDKTKPLTAFLFPGAVMVDLIEEAGERKSLSYQTACERLDAYRLPWVTGEARWRVDADHPFERLVNEGHPDPGRKYRPDGEAARAHPHPADAPAAGQVLAGGFLPGDAAFETAPSFLRRGT